MTQENKRNELDPVKSSKGKFKLGLTHSLRLYKSKMMLHASIKSYKKKLGKNRLSMFFGT